jgi:hypothetical protein
LAETNTLVFKHFFHPLIFFQMACSFGYIENACGCLIGYTLPLKAEDNTDISGYPVNVLNVNGDDLGEAASPSALVALWNSDNANKAVGTLSLGAGTYCFTLSYVKNVTPPSKITAAGGTPPAPTTFGFDYGATDLDTTGAAKTEAEYIASVDAVYTASGEVAGTPVDNGSNVQVDDFGNSTDKVLFMQVNGSEAAFTKWSVVGDSLQQNQPIDGTFGAGSNVWFKSTRGGKTIYITRSQTSFAAPVLFSR